MYESCINLILIAKIFQIQLHVVYALKNGCSSGPKYFTHRPDHDLDNPCPSPDLNLSGHIDP